MHSDGVNHLESTSTDVAESLGPIPGDIFSAQMRPLLAWTHSVSAPQPCLCRDLPSFAGQSRRIFFCASSLSRCRSYACLPLAHCDNPVFVLSRDCNPTWPMVNTYQSSKLRDLQHEFVTGYVDVGARCNVAQFVVANEKRSRVQRCTWPAANVWLQSGQVSGRSPCQKWRLSFHPDMTGVTPTMHLGPRNPPSVTPTPRNVITKSITLTACLPSYIPLAGLLHY